MATPKYLLEQALARFPILLVKSEERQERYLRDSLEFYALHAGMLIRAEMTQPELLITPPPLGFNGCYNHFGDWQMTKYDAATNKLHVLDDVRNGPWSVSWFQNIRNWDLETELPRDIEFTLVIDHIESLLGEANAQQMALSRFVASLDGMEQKQASEYSQQRQMVEEAIRKQAHLPDFAIL